MRVNPYQAQKTRLFVYRHRNTLNLKKTYNDKASNGFLILIFLLLNHEYSVGVIVCYGLDFLFCKKKKKKEKEEKRKKKCASFVRSNV